ncbi:uncharacterized protein LOC134692187 [Mytilus trossulus]|uniref:uncharacterized protein LOC134692187 n=1 Tax=Mytilus trossulus TaxID=6551 RepID=UPI0030042FCB
MESLILFLMVTICFIKADDNLAWKVVKKALQFGDDLHLFCQVKNCCQKSAGWGKWTSDDHLITIFIDVKNLHNDGSLKYSGGTNKTGFFLRIRNITQGDLNISYSCTYGFQVSRKKNLLMEDALFSPPKTIETINRFKGL